MFGVVTVTLNPALDLACSVDRVVPERKLRCSVPEARPGGGGVNVARALGSLGGSALAIWTQGGTVGARMGGLLDGERVSHVPVRVAGETREHLIVLESGTGKQYRFGMPGPPLSAAAFDAVRDAVDAVSPPPRFLVLSGSLPPGAPVDAYATLARDAAARGVQVIVDTSGDALRHAVEAGVFLLKPNLRELQTLAGSELASDVAIQGAAQALVASGHAGAVVVSLGAAGAMLVTGDATVMIRAPTVPQRSRVGAGDSMVAGLVLGLARDLALVDAARFGVAAGAAAVMNPGPGLSRRADAERLFEQVLREAP